MVKRSKKKADSRETDIIYSLLDVYETDLGTVAGVDILGGKTGRQKLLNVATGRKKGFSPKQRARAVHLLGALKVSEALEPFVQLLGSKEEAIRVNVMYALGQLGSESAIAALREVLGNKKTPVIEKAHAIKILGEIGDSDVVTEMQEVVSREHDPTLKKEALKAIKSIEQRKKTASANRHQNIWID